MRAEPLLSACLIVRNEAGNLKRCLASLAGLADEIIVVDTGSTDDTPAIALSFGARVHPEPWREDFSFHRNSAIDLATGRWIYFIDADEEVVETDFAETRHHLEHSHLPPVLLVQESVRYPSGVEGTLALPRLFLREAGFRYVFPIDEQLDAMGSPAAMSNIRVVHYGYISPDELRRKEARNLAIARAMPDSFHAFHCRARAAFSLEKWVVVVAAAEKLAESKETPIVAAEACMLGGAASIRMGDLEGAKRFASLARERLPDSPDANLLEVLVAAQTYLDSLGERDSGASGTTSRNPMILHRKAPVLAMMDMLLGRQRFPEAIKGTKA